jgi:hypothetical protein
VNILKSSFLVAFLVAAPGLALAQEADPFINLYNDGVTPPGINSANGIGSIQPGCTSFYAIPGTDPTTGDPTCTYYFTNNAGGILDGFSFEASLAPNSPVLENIAYSCQDFFYDMNCSASYNSQTGLLSYVFTLTDPDGGIPTEGPNSTFYIVLGNWTTIDGFNFADVTLTNSYSVPEESTTLAFAAEFLLFLGAFAYLRRRAKVKQYSGL